MTTMNPFDLTVLIIIVLSTFWGGMRGIISQVGAFAAWIVSLIVSARYYVVFEPLVPVAEGLKTPCAAFAAFLVSFIAISIATRFVKRAVSLVGFKEFDRQIGALFGLLKGAALCVAITFFCVLASDKTRNVVDSSKSGAFFISVIAEVQDAFPDSDLKTKFDEIATSLKKSEENKSVDDEIDSLKNYLTTHVFTTTAAQVVKEADEEEEAEESGATTKGRGTSLFQRFVDGARGLNQKIEAQVNKTTPNIALESSTGSNASNATGNYANSSRYDYDYSASNADATANAPTEEKNAESGFQKFWNSLGGSSALPAATASTSPQSYNAQTQISQEPASNSNATYSGYARQSAVENDASSASQAGYGGYRTRSDDSSSRLRSYRYSIVGPSNY